MIIIGQLEIKAERTWGRCWRKRYPQTIRDDETRHITKGGLLAPSRRTYRINASDVVLAARVDSNALRPPPQKLSPFLLSPQIQTRNDFGTTEAAVLVI